MGSTLDLYVRTRALPRLREHPPLRGGLPILFVKTHQAGRFSTFSRHTCRKARFFQPAPPQSRKKKRPLRQDRPLGKATGAGRRRKCVGRRRRAGRRAAKVARPGISRLLFALRRLQPWVKCRQARVDIFPPAGAAGSCYLETRKTRLAALLISRQELAYPGTCGAAGPGEEHGNSARRKFAGLIPWDAAKGTAPPPFRGEGNQRIPVSPGIAQTYLASNTPRPEMATALVRPWWLPFSTPSRMERGTRLEAMMPLLW
jgi:hypothetical protein